jgi:hypothetical protein
LKEPKYYQLLFLPKRRRTVLGLESRTRKALELAATQAPEPDLAWEADFQRKRRLVLAPGPVVGQALGFSLGLAPPKNEKSSFSDAGTGVTVGAGSGAILGVGTVLRLPKNEEKASVTGFETLTSLTSLSFEVATEGFFGTGFLAAIGLGFGVETPGFSPLNS